MSGLVFNTRFDGKAGEAHRVVPAIVRICAPNPSALTFTGTNSYVIEGEDEAAIVDPGPIDQAHQDALLTALGPRRLTAILVTHTHKDHAPLAERLRERTGAAIIGCRPHDLARPRRAADPDVDAFSDLAYRPDRILDDGDRLHLAGHQVTAVATPGHTANHLAFLIEAAGLRYLFSGDAVMGWSTTVIIPPEGSMAAYLKTLERLADLECTAYLPGHGDVLNNPRPYLRALKAHRLQRESLALNMLGDEPASLYALLPKVYPGLDSTLLVPAGHSLLAHLDHLEERGLAERSLEGREWAWRRA